MNSVNPFFFPHDAFSPFFLPASFDGKLCSKGSAGDSAHLFWGGSDHLCSGALPCALGVKSTPLSRRPVHQEQFGAQCSDS